MSSSYCQCTECVYNNQNLCDDVVINHYNSDSLCSDVALNVVLFSGRFIVKDLNEFLNL